VRQTETLLNGAREEMPSALTYPGVYIEEIPSGVRTISGVATSIAAFVGRTLSGPVDEPVVITNFGDFERQFGGLWAASPMTYAVRDFFANGGAQAVIVRGYKAPAGGGGGASGKARIFISALAFEAASPGTWGNDLRVRIVTASTEVAPGDPSLFNLLVALVRYDASNRVAEVAGLEVHRNVSLLQTHKRRIDHVLRAESKLIRSAGFSPSTDPTTKPSASTDPTPANELWGKNTGNTTSVGVLPADEGSDGDPLDQAALTGGTTQSDGNGLYALDRTDLFNLLCIPPHSREDDGDIENQLIEDAISYCKKRRAIFLIDPPRGWRSRAEAVSGVTSSPTTIGSASANAALFFPRIQRSDPVLPTVIDDFAPCGAVAGVIARTDVERGVWKAPAGFSATIVGAPDLSVKLTEGDIGLLNPLGVNCLRSMPNLGNVIWGSRTREGADALASEWKYLPVRRLTLYIEESLYRGTQWVVFEPNDEPLWASIRLNVGAFMHSLFRQGAFQGQTAREAYEVKCDSETTTQDDINRGIVNIVVRFAPLKPAEFVVIKIQQLAGQVQA
jgi:phage tail sheath protein FI